ncbi:hypothetical protein JOB18_049445 [Solea senegalensis]|uniref:Uncharacterized protein n=1 Tax=Solea senegalensis TaxID=28829 RepID=A0AAV6R7V0_SOLSE|nr:hypothetical protein JOB18_049445 [Solea senegalensis]
MLTHPGPANGKSEWISERHGSTWKMREYEATREDTELNNVNTVSGQLQS